MPHQCTDCGTVFADGSTEMLSGCPDCGGDTFQFIPEGAAASSESTGELEGSPDVETPPAVDRPDRSSPGESVAKTVGNAAKTVRELVGNENERPGTAPDVADPLAPWPAESPSRTDDATSDSGVDSGENNPTHDDATTAREETTRDRNANAHSTHGEDLAQASARSAVVTPDELPASGAAEVAAGASSPADAATSTGPESEDPTPDRQSSPDWETDAQPDLETLREELNDQFESIRIVEPGQYELNLMELYEREEYIIALQEDGRYQIQVPEAWQDS
ncbi:MAG: Zn-ribbon containing protein [Halorhabdus sp.]